MRSSFFLAPCLALSLSACYQAVPVAPSDLRVGREVDFELSERGSLELAPALGAQLKAVTGRVTDVSPRAYGIAVTQTVSRTGIETLWRGESAQLPQDYITRVAERRLDKKRTTLVSVLAFAGVVAAGEAFGINTGLDGLIGGGGRGTRK